MLPKIAWKGRSDVHNPTEVVVIDEMRSVATAALVAGNVLLGFDTGATGAVDALPIGTEVGEVEHPRLASIVDKRHPFACVLGVVFRSGAHVAVFWVRNGHRVWEVSWLSVPTDTVSFDGRL